ncbi:hypothetical protein PG996_009748 [Apiospora saccharicola]|uniref:DUF1995 domain-containing protein n=1 Tax=Apiospora saccharicola TaxID=335842 RepID=A0ABR1ULM5_9PEZI
MDLPVLSDAPLSHPNCCLTLSTRLLQTLKDFFQDDSSSSVGERPESLVLSVGCGSGLLESLLHSYLTQEEAQEEPVVAMTTAVRVEGVEVASATSSYLPEDRANTVAGTWALCRRAEDAAALMFVYPRSVDLFKRYVDAFFGSGKARTIVWLGPQADWEVFQPALEGQHGASKAQLTIREGSDCGIGDYEMMAVLQAPERDI